MPCYLRSFWDWVWWWLILIELRLYTTDQLLPRNHWQRVAQSNKSLKNLGRWYYSGFLKRIQTQKSSMLICVGALILSWWEEELINRRALESGGRGSCHCKSSGKFPCWKWRCPTRECKWWKRSSSATCTRQAWNLYSKIFWAHFLPESLSVCEHFWLGKSCRLNVISWATHPIPFVSHIHAHFAMKSSSTLAWARKWVSAIQKNAESIFSVSSLSSPRDLGSQILHIMSVTLLFCWGYIPQWKGLCSILPWSMCAKACLISFSFSCDLTCVAQNTVWKRTSVCLCTPDSHSDSTCIGKLPCLEHLAGKFTSMCKLCGLSSHYWSYNLTFILDCTLMKKRGLLGASWPFSVLTFLYIRIASESQNNRE